MVGKSLQDLLLSLPATKHTPRLPYRASHMRMKEERNASLCRLHSVLLGLGGDTPQPCHELQLPCQQSTLDEGALWQLHPDSLTVSKPTTVFTVVR